MERGSGMVAERAAAAEAEAGRRRGVTPSPRIRGVWRCKREIRSKNIQRYKRETTRTMARTRTDLQDRRSQYVGYVVSHPVSVRVSVVVNLVVTRE